MVDFYRHADGCRRQSGLSWSDVAQALNVPRGSFAAWKSRGELPHRLFQSLCNLVGWNVLPNEAENLGLRFLDDRSPRPRPGTHPLLAAFLDVDRRRQQIDKGLDAIAKMTVRLFEAMDEKSFFVLITATVSPLEFTSEGEQLGEKLIEAIGNGATCLYIRPDAGRIAYYEDEWGFDRIVPYGVADKQFEYFREAARKELAKAAGDRKAEQMVYEQLGQCTVSDSPFFFPGMTVGLHGCNTGKESLATRLTLRLPGDMFGGAFAYPSYPVFESQ